MAKQRSSRRGDIDIFLVIAILLIFIVGASTAGGRLGGLGKGLNTGLASVFGTEPAPCPFLQKGALSGMLGMAGGSKIGDVYLSDLEGSSCDSTSPKTKIRMYWNTTEDTTVLDLGPSPSFDYCQNVRLETMINPATQELVSGNTISAFVCNSNVTGTQTDYYICCDRTSGPCICSQEDSDEKQTSKIPGRTDKFYCTLRYYMMTEGLGFSAQSANDAAFGQFATTPFPPYICILIFGLVPFLVMYYLIQDLLFFVMLSQTTKKMISVAIAGMAIVTGAFADLSYVLTKLTGIALSWSFLFMIFGTGLVSIVITNLMGVTSAASAMHKSLNEAHYGFYMLKSFGQQLEQVAKK